MLFQACLICVQAYQPLSFCVCVFVCVMEACSLVSLMPPPVTSCVLPHMPSETSREHDHPAEAAVAAALPVLKK